MSVSEKVKKLIRLFLLADISFLLFRSMLAAPAIASAFNIYPIDAPLFPTFFSIAAETMGSTSVTDLLLKVLYLFVFAVVLLTWCDCFERKRKIIGKAFAVICLADALLTIFILCRQDGSYLLGAINSAVLAVLATVYDLLGKHDSNGKNETMAESIKAPWKNRIETLTECYLAFQLLLPVVDCICKTNLLVPNGVRTVEGLRFAVLPTALVNMLTELNVSLSLVKPMQYVAFIAVAVLFVLVSTGGNKRRFASATALWLILVADSLAMIVILVIEKEIFRPVYLIALLIQLVSALLLYKYSAYLKKECM